LENWEAKSLTELRARSDKFIPTFEEAPQDALIAAADVQNITDEMDRLEPVNNCYHPIITLRFCVTLFQDETACRICMESHTCSQG